jgi:hypothetical protein
VTRRPRTGRAGPRTAAGQSGLLVLPLVLLIILGLAGLRGVVVTPRWNGPLRQDGVAIGLGLEAVLGALLAMMIRRRSRLSHAARLSGIQLNDMAARLRVMLILILGAGMIALGVTIDNSRPHGPGGELEPLYLGHGPHHHMPPVHKRPPGGLHVPLPAIVYGLFIVVLVAAAVVSLWWARMFRLPPAGNTDDVVAEDPEDLREAVESGRSALRVADGTRAAIIACYLAMESSLAERGAARAAADTPDELLARAASRGLVRGTATARLTALFYEARFSSHPMATRQRDEAEYALDEIAAALAEPP